MKLPRQPKYDLGLFVAGTATWPLARKIREFCDRHLKGRYTLRVVDLYQQPELAASEQILATPTLVRRSPVPRRFLVGRMTTAEQFLQALDLVPTASP